MQRRAFLHQSARLFLVSLVGRGLLGQARLSATEVPVEPSGSPTREWHLFRGNSHATGVAQAKLPEDPQILWRYQVEKGAFSGTPVIVDGLCMVGDLDGTLHAFQLSDGQVQWTKKTDSLGFAASPAYRQDCYYLGDLDGKFYCFQREGEVKWSFSAEQEINSSASFYGQLVLFGSQDSTLYALNVANGELAWKIQMQDQIRCSPTVVENRSFVAGCDGQLHVVDLDLGKEIGTVPIENPTGVTPAVDGDHVYFGTEGGDVFCVDWRRLSVVWRFRDDRPREIRSSPSVSGNRVVLGSRGKKVYGLDATTGKEAWTLSCKRGIDSSPVILGELVFIADTSGRVYLLELKSGEVRWQKETGSSFSGSPAVSDNRVVIASDDGVVYCFG